MRRTTGAIANEINCKGVHSTSRHDGTKPSSRGYTCYETTAIKILGLDVELLKLAVSMRRTTASTAPAALAGGPGGTDCTGGTSGSGWQRGNLCNIFFFF